MAGSTGARWDPRFDTDSAFYLPKWKSDVLQPAPDQPLAEHQIEQQALAGLQASACVTATVKSALASGLGCSCSPMPSPAEPTPAETPPSTASPDNAPNSSAAADPGQHPAMTAA
jgi:hypothetical protein